MALDRVDWHDLPAHVRDVIETRTGPVRSAQTASAGKNSAVALLLDTQPTGGCSSRDSVPIIPAW